MTQDHNIEAEIQAKGKTAARVTPDDLQANIASEHYFTADEAVYGQEVLNHETVSTPNPSGPLGLLTFCVLVLRNGLTVTGESACASPENFDAEIGRKIARENAVSKCWPLMGYALKSQLAERSGTKAAPCKLWEVTALEAIFLNFGEGKGIDLCGESSIDFRWSGDFQRLDVSMTTQQSLRLLAADPADGDEHFVGTMAKDMAKLCWSWLERDRLENH